MTTFKKYVLLFTLSTFTLYAKTLTGVGYAPNEASAKKEALADLSYIIKSEVRAKAQENLLVSGENIQKNSSSKITVSSNLPLLGVVFKTNSAKQMATASLSTKEVQKVYTAKLHNLNKEINATQKALEKMDSNSQKLQQYENLLSLLKEFDKYSSVTMLLEIPTIQPTLTKAYVKAELDKLNTKIDSIEMAAELLAKEFKKNKVYLYPPLLEHTSTATLFSSLMLKQLKSKINTVNNPLDAEYILQGEYTLSPKNMYLNYELLDAKEHKIVASKTLTINAKAYKGVEVTPKNIEFDQLIHQGIVTSGKLHVALNSNKGDQNLLFHEGEDVSLFVKLNKLGYFYIVGYTQTAEGSFSYLLELQEGEGSSKFVKFVNADDASRWINLGSFSVEAPFGVETLQVIASNKKFTQLPAAAYDEESGYYVISNSLKKGLEQTRGLKRKKSHKIEMSEDILNFTTME